MKRAILVGLLSAIVAISLCGCGGSEKANEAESRLAELEAQVSALENMVSELQNDNDALMTWKADIESAEAEAKAAAEAAKPDFNALMESAPTDGSVSVAADGLSMTIDTNPLNIDNYVSREAFAYIEEVNDALGLPDSLYERMGATRALDGTQTADYDNVFISWSYHPDSGLKVIYESK